MGWLQRRNNLSIFIILAVVVFIIYGNSLFNGFVYDDGYLIVKNGFIKDFSRVNEVFSKDLMLVTPIGKPCGFYRPFSMVFLMVNYKVWGLNPWGWHFSSILLHLASTFLTYLLLKEILPLRAAAFLAALVFAVHPIHVEAVTPVFNSMGLLATFFGLGSFLAFVKGKKRNKREYFFLSLLLLIAAVFSKEETLVLPLVFIAYDFYFHSQFKIREIRRQWKLYSLFFAACVFYLGMRFLVIEKGAVWGLWGLNPILNYNIQPTANVFYHLLTVFKICFRYLVLLFFPVNLCAFPVISPVHSFLDIEALFSLLLVLGLVACAVHSREEKPFFSFFTALFFISSSLILNIIPIGGIFAERFMYFPSIAYCALVGYIFAAMFTRYASRGQQDRGKIVILIFGVIFSLYALQASMRNYVWRSNISLWRDTAQKTPSWFTHTSLGYAYYEAGLYPQALAEYVKAVAFPSYKEYNIRSMIGRLYGMREQYDEALREFQKALQLNPEFTEAYYSAGITYFNKGDLKSALSYFKKTVDQDPRYPWGYYGLGLVYQKQGNPVLAHDYFTKALALDPQFTLAAQALEKVAP